MPSFAENSRVHIPSRCVGLGPDYPSAMVECRFRGMLGKKGIVDQVPRTRTEFEVDVRLITRKLGFLVVQLGDFDTEVNLLEPLHSAICATTALVLMPEYVWKIRIRSLDEFKHFWDKQAALVSHLILVGNGSKTGLTFGNQNVRATAFNQILDGPQNDGQAPLIVSLCCNSGNGVFGKAVSGSPSCRAFIGPSGPIHVANAALFYQSLVSHSLIDGRSSQIAYQRSRVFTPGVTEFNMWRKTKLVHKPSRKEVLGIKS